ncbi:MAG: asparagine synthase-related protein [Gemmatimonadaceae bacterium]
MSAIAGLFSTRDRGDLGSMLDAFLDSMPHRGASPRGNAQFGNAALGVRRFAWEEAPTLAGPARVARHGDVAVVADAAIFYRHDLRRALSNRGRPCESEEPSELILAAYLAFGPDCVLHLEGDYAFLVFDGRVGHVLLARDHVGRRPLHYVVAGDLLAAASTARALATHPTIRAPLHLPAIAAAVGGLLGGSNETGFVGVSPVPAGTAMVWRPGGEPRVVSAWSTPEFRVGGRARLEEGARDLRRLLTAAVRERADPLTAVWLSGGADSTAVFGAAQLARQGSRESGGGLLPITVSYPEGDTAREDHHVEAIARQWSAPVTWIDSEAVRLLDDASIRAAVRDDPYAHTFEHMNRRLAQTSMSVGARVAFDGYGGDQLFHVSDAYLADLFVRLRWGELRRALDASAIRGLRGLVRSCVVPWLPESTYRAIQRARGRDGALLFSQTLPSWLAPSWKERAALQSRVDLEPSRRLFESPSAYESRWYTTTPYFPRAVSWAGAIALEGGVEVRSPIMDRRIITFAASRPLSERAAAGESKLLLRQAMKGLIPDSVLAPRPTKTGIPRAYLHRRIGSELPAAAAQVFANDRSLLADLGIIELALYREALAKYLTTTEHIAGVQLLLTLQCELWLRSVANPA